MRILLLGNNGQVGWEAQRALAPLGEVIALDYPDVDFTRPAQLARLVAELRPQVIYNAVAYTAVDKGESEPERVRVINAAAPGVLAESAARLGAVLVHFSTDYVFDGQKGAAYTETDEPRPLSIYGQSKLESEQVIEQADCAALILRTAWVYSMRADRDSFVRKVMQWAKDRPSLRIVSDQVSNPTWARMLAETTALLLARGGSDLRDYLYERRGIYHLAGGGWASRMEWAQEIVRLSPPADHPVEILPACTTDFPTPAERPLFSALDCDKFTRVFGLSLPGWKDALRLAMRG